MKRNDLILGFELKLKVYVCGLVTLELKSNHFEVTGHPIWRGGGGGEEPRERPTPVLIPSAPRALAEARGSVRAQSFLPDPTAMPK